MIVKRTIMHRIQMQEQYESVTVSAEITLDTDEDPDETFDKVDALLASAIEKDLDEAVRLSSDDSYSRDWRTE